MIDTQKEAVQSAEEAERQLAELNGWVSKLNSRADEASRDENVMRDLCSKARELAKQGQIVYSLVLDPLDA